MRWEEQIENHVVMVESRNRYSVALQVPGRGVHGVFDLPRTYVASGSKAAVRAAPGGFEHLGSAEPQPAGVGELVTGGVGYGGIGRWHSPIPARCSGSIWTS
jgi:hypothetical protein